MAKTACQLYILREHEESLPKLIKAVGEAGFDGVEFAYRVDEHEPQELRGVIDRTELGVAGAHIHKDELDEHFEAVVTRNRSLGCERIVIPWLDEELFASRQAIESTGEMLESLADELADHDMALSYHNHVHEFDQVGDQSALEHLIDVTDERLGIQLDVGIAHAAGADPVSLLDRLDGRIPTIHFRDHSATDAYDVVPGEGDVDLIGCAEAARAGGTEWFIYEGPDEPLAQAANAINALID